MSDSPRTGLLPRWQRPARDDFYSRRLRERRAHASAPRRAEWLDECEALGDAMGSDRRASLRGQGAGLFLELLHETPGA